MIDWMEFAEDRGALTPCALCEAMLPDAVDGTLTAAEDRWFAAHVQACPACAAEWADAQRGAAWLHVLKAERPEPRPELMARVLAQTTGSFSSIAEAAPARASAPLAFPAPPPAPIMAPAVATLRNGQLGVSARVLPFLRRGPAQPGSYIGLQPRLLMTAAMAFFSLALTANMLGLQPADLRPGHVGPALRHTLNHARNSMERSVEQAPLVSQLESTLDRSTQGKESQ